MFLLSLHDIKSNIFAFKMRKKTSWSMGANGSKCIIEASIGQIKSVSVFLLVRLISPRAHGAFMSKGQLQPKELN